MLYIIGTPIGNLNDISKRAIDTLKNVDVVIMESPTDSKKLLNLLGIRGKVVRKFNDENAKSVCEKLVSEMSEKNAAYITSAGMPSISDPGALLVKTAREQGIDIQVIPGPSAVTTALAGSGIRTNEFMFVGFLPRKASHIEKLFKKYLDLDTVLIFFESPFRIVRSIEILMKVAPHAHICAAKELTKLFENYFIGEPAEVLEKLRENKKNVKGEFTIVVDSRNKE